MLESVFCEMEKHNFVRNGALRLPPGFRFHPTDEELVVQYLQNKVLSCPLPASFIPEVDVCKFDPWDLPGNLEQERYYFSTREAKYPNGNRSNRATGSGYWKATGIDKKIVSSRGNKVVGMKKTLVFYRGKPPHGSRTDWIMHEYRFVSTETTKAANAPQGKPSTQSPTVPVDNWVLCRIFLKKRSSKNEDENVQFGNDNATGKLRTTKPVFYDFMRKDGTDLNVAPVSSSSGSSGVTEVSTQELDDHEESSSCNSFPYFRRKP